MLKAGARIVASNNSSSSYISGEKTLLIKGVRVYIIP
jgi:hypothetical protein